MVAVYSVPAANLLSTSAGFQLISAFTLSPVNFELSVPPFVGVVSEPLKDNSDVIGFIIVIS